MPSTATESLGRQIRLATEDVAPPNSIYLTQDDGLWLYAAANYNAQLRVVIRLLLPDGSMSLNVWDFSVPGTRAQTIFTQPLGEGFLMGVHVYDSTIPARRGQCYASINVQRETTTNNIRPMRLVQGYITFFSRLYWPGGGWEDSYSGRGNIRSIAGTTPAAGADISETVPSNATWRPIGFSYRFASSVAVAARESNLVIDDGANTLIEMQGPATIPASNTIDFTYAAGLPISNLGNGIWQAALAQEVYMPPGFRFRTRTANIQAADQYSQVRYLVEEWLSP